MVQTTDGVRTNPALRLLPPSEVTGPRWAAHDILERRGYRLAREAAAVLVAAFRPAPARDLADRLAAMPHSPYDGERWMASIAALRERGLLVDAHEHERNPRFAWMADLRAQWSRMGWREAAEYHIATFDYPCVDYGDASGFLVDDDRMRRYQSEQPDDNRYKLDYVSNNGLPLPDAGSDRESATARELWVGARVPPAPLDRKALERLLSLTFGTTGQRVQRTVSTPVLLRTSPSGGARHPSEGYVVVRAVEGVDPGWYHVTMRPFSLRQLDVAAAGEDVLDRAFPDTYRRSPFPVGAIMIVTSVFERNMYRYREPRTFRTVHMDAGHLAGTLSIAARATGINAVVFWGDNAAEIERLLAIDGMREGYMLTVGLGGAGPDGSGGDDGERNHRRAASGPERGRR